MFIILALLFGTIIAFINPPLQECDAFSHLMRSMDVSYGNILGSFVNLTHEDGVIYVPENFMEVNNHIVEPYGGEGGEYVAYMRERTFSTNKIKIECHDNITSIVYWPQGLGIWLGRMLNVSMYGVIVWGRIFNLLAYVGLTFCAIRKIPFLKNFFMLTALLPITLYQASSLSADSVMNGLCFLFMALCFSYAFGECEQLTWKNALLLGILLLGMFIGKYVYVCLGMLVFLIPQKYFGRKDVYCKSFIIALLPLLVVGCYLVLRVYSGILYPQESVADIGNSSMTQVQYLKENPFALIKVLASTVLVFTNEYLRQLNVLGSLNYGLDFFVILGPCITGVVGILDVPSAANRLKIKHRVLMAATFVITFSVILVGLYLADHVANPPGSDVVSGVQGRYFISLLPLPFLVFASKKLKNDIDYFALKVSGVTALMLCYTVFMLIRLCY